MINTQLDCVRKAISFSGQSRFVKEGYETLKRNLVDFESYDVFVHTWTQGPLNQDVLKLYKPKSYCIELQKHVIPAQVKEYTESAFTHFSMFYTMMESLKLKSQYEKFHNFKYNLVIRTRFDIGLETKLDPTNFDVSKEIYSPDVCANPSVISDWFNFGSSENIDVYAEIYNNIVDFYKQGVMITSGEELITHMLKIKTIPIVKIPCDLYLLRDKNIHKNLSRYWKYAN